MRANNNNAGVVAALFASWLLFAATVCATEPPLRISLQLDSGAPLSIAPPPVRDTGGEARFVGERHIPDAGDLRWDVEVRREPAMAVRLSLTNDTERPRDYTVDVAMRVPSARYVPARLQSVVRSAVLDHGAGGPMPRRPVYMAMVDDTPIASLESEPVRLTAPAGEARPAVHAMPRQDALVEVPAVYRTLGNRFHFTLPPGAQVTFESQLALTPLPFPLAAVLTGSALLVVLLVVHYRRLRRARFD